MIENIINNINSLAKDNLELFCEIVEDIISSNCKDENYIETSLDKLLDMCFDENILILYKKLCRYYFDINPQATKDYVMYYYERYEKDGNLTVRKFRTVQIESKNHGFVCLN